MKANETPPEKIYLKPLLMEDGESVVRRCTFERQRDSQIEYTRTDAFIDKASGWIEENIKKWYENIRVHGFRGMTPLMIIEFRKYMEGE